jgi:hypothetical protein
MEKTTLLKLGLLSGLILLLLPLGSVNAQETFLWGADVPASGAPVTSPVLEAGREYRIVASEMWFYDFPGNLGADAQYYTTDPTSSWHWGNHFPAPDGHSFLQIDSQDVSWGPFSNGDTGHTYTIYYTGTGAAITFSLVDWIDGDYTNNHCHLPVEIWEGPPTEIGKSPGYWGHEFRAYYDGKGKPHHTWAELVAWTEDIDDYYGATPPAFDSYVLPPVDSMDTDGDGVFEPDDAYTIFNNKKDWKDVWIGCANWYNWAAGFPPYY